MCRQVVCYIKRELISDWKRKVITHPQRAFVYGSRDERIFSRLRKGDLLWIVSPIKNRPPELVACLDVEIVAPAGTADLQIGDSLERRFAHWKYIARGGANSVFFGHNNASQAMMETRFINPSSRLEWCFSDLASTWNSQFGKKFIRPYEITIPENGETIFKSLTALPQVFISWKRFDIDPKYILSLAYALADQGIMAWLDLLALPDSISLKVAQKRSTELVDLLKYGYERCNAVLVVESEHYMEKSKASDENWTEKEWDGSIAEHIPSKKLVFRPREALPSSNIPTSFNRMASETPTQAALELKEMLLQDD